MRATVCLTRRMPPTRQRSSLASLSRTSSASPSASRSYAELLDLPIDAVWLPLPIHLHRPYTERALAAGKAVLCEKPAAGCVDDVDAMIAARDASGRGVLIGFQDVYQPCVIQLKRR